MVQSLLDAIRSAPPALAYTIIALLVFGESAFFAGFVLPGETAVLLVASWRAGAISTSSP